MGSAISKKADGCKIGVEEALLLFTPDPAAATFLLEFLRVRALEALLNNGALLDSKFLELEFGVFITVVGVVPPHSKDKDVEIKLEFDLDLVFKLILGEGSLCRKFPLAPTEVSERELLEEELVVDFLNGLPVSKKCARWFSLLVVLLLLLLLVSTLSLIALFNVGKMC